MSIRVAVMAGVIFLGAGLLAGCDVSSSPSPPPDPQTNLTINTDPRLGWVTVVSYEDGEDDDVSGIAIYKRCDGTNLVYITPGLRSGAHGISAIPNSLECQK